MIRRDDSEEKQTIRYLHARVHTEPGDAIVITLRGKAADIFLLNNENYRSYCLGDPFRSIGGHYKKSPAILRPPAGDWHVAVDLGEKPRHVSAEVRVIRND
jgi:hypothetical protein